MKNTRQQLAQLVGIKDRYQDVFGSYHFTSSETQIALLNAMGINATTPQAIDASFAEIKARPWRKFLPPVLVVKQIKMPLSVSGSLSGIKDTTHFSWYLQLENGDVIEGDDILCNLSRKDVQSIGGVLYQRFSLLLPANLPLGYHSLKLDIGKQTDRCTIIVVPSTCYQPDWYVEGKRVWGINCHLYALRTAHDWGIGNFGALMRLAETGMTLGIDMLGTNPLHAMFWHHPEHASPYSPSSRLHLNAFNIDIPAVPEFTLAKKFLSDDLVQSIANIRKKCLIDYSKVVTLKSKALEAMFKILPKSLERWQAFQVYRRKCGVELRHFCLHEVLAEKFNGQPWSLWGEAYNNPNTSACHRIAEEKSERMAFHAYVQWITDNQLSAVSNSCARAEFRVGLCRDLAVGANPDGAEVWINQDIIAKGIHCGSPPDAFSSKGQDWGVVPYNPLILYEQAYRPFIRLLQENMRYAGALRIDHVMSLQRLFWISQDKKAPPGAYVTYPLDDLLGIIALESQRNQCLIIGEDLGTVPKGFRQRLKQQNIQSCRLLYFERWPDGLFKRPNTYPRIALSMPGTHDLPTLRGYWEGKDLAIRRGLKMYSDTKQIDIDETQRMYDREQLIAALIDQGFLSARFPIRADIDRTQIDDLIIAVYHFLACSNCVLTMVNLDDVMGEVEQLNFPGTISEHPNWRRRISKNVENLVNDTIMLRIAKIMREEQRSKEG